MNSVASHPQVSAKDRLAFTLFLSLALNAAIILGISFDLYDPNKEDSPLPTLDVVLVEKSDSEAAEDAEFLSQFAQSGAGNSQNRTPPSTQEAAPDLPIPFSGDSEIMQLQQTQTINTSSQQELLTAHQSNLHVADEKKPDKNKQDQITSQELIMRGQEIARLTAEIQQSIEVYSKRAKHRYISANTKEFRDAAYLDAWRRKIERIGNLNYPEEAKRRKLSGNLVLDVAINTNGTIRSVTVLHSSGKKLLDDAAVRIVRLAAPFAPLPPEIREDTDILHITRTWQFMSGNRLRTN